MNIEEVYKQLTGVDIEKQKILWDERGKGYYGEFLVFCELCQKIPGHCKILMNLNIPTGTSKTTEIDLVLIHETGLYVFEIKHYKGTIYGKSSDATWTQYFRTTKNSSFRNPMLQNEYHISALKQLLPNTPIHSCIVFTNDDCEIKVTNSNIGTDVCRLRDVLSVISRRFTYNNLKYSMADIDNTFVLLSQYSQMKEEIPIDEKIADFSSWVQPFISKLEEKKNELEKEKEELKKASKKLKKVKISGIALNVFVAIICIVGSVFITSGIVAKNNADLSEFKQKFLHIDEIDNEYIDSLKTYVEVSDAVLKPLTEDAVSFDANLTILNDSYGITIAKDAKYIVIKEDGTVFEYNVFEEHLVYNELSNTLGKGYRMYGALKTAYLYGISDIDDISYIKITGINLFRLDTFRKTIKDNLEIELYSK